MDIIIYTVISTEMYRDIYAIVEARFLTRKEAETYISEHAYEDKDFEIIEEAI